MDWHRCRKCLLRDLKEDDYFKSLKEYIDGIEEEWKAAPSIYEERLGICRECDKLQEAMCRGCGCFVELRAVMKKNSCPYEKWKKVI